MHHMYVYDVMYARLSWFLYPLSLVDAHPLSSSSILILSLLSILTLFLPSYYDRQMVAHSPRLDQCGGIGVVVVVAIHLHYIEIKNVETFFIF